MYPDTLREIISNLDFETLSKERKAILAKLTDFIDSEIAEGKTPHLNFICTHNSRRSQFSQVWAHVASYYFGIVTKCYSGGVEVTECNPRTVASLKRFGFLVSSDKQVNQKYNIKFTTEGHDILLYSKMYNCGDNPQTGFAGILTCDHADSNCPIVIGAKQRIPIKYEDPKKFDDTELEARMYDKRSLQIATEMFYVFSEVRVI